MQLRNCISVVNFETYLKNKSKKYYTTKTLLRAFITVSTKTLIYKKIVTKCDEIELNEWIKNKTEFGLIYVREILGSILVSI